VQPPVPSQVDVDWQRVGTQLYAVPPQAPPVHTSPWVHGSPSLHPVPFGLGVVAQPPAPSQADVAWHWSGVQVCAMPAQAPALQKSLKVHGLPSSHATAWAAHEHVPASTSHEHAWHGSVHTVVPSVHRTARVCRPMPLPGPGSQPPRPTARATPKVATAATTPRGAEPTIWRLLTSTSRQPRRGSAASL
jgi:hypothetical protein